MFRCNQCQKLIGPGSSFFDMRTMTPKYYTADPKTHKPILIFCSPQCSLDWHQVNKDK